MSDKPGISVLIPLYRGQATLKSCLESLLAQEGVSLEILLLDNGCPENSGEWAGYFLARQDGVKWKLFEEPTNIGFAAGMNRLYAESSCPLVLFLNQDVILAKECLKELAAALDRHPGWAAVTGILYRTAPGISEDAPRIIDTTGHLIFRDRVVRNRGAGKLLNAGEQLPYEEGEVFGVSAACALYRREALESCREKEGPFDPDFFSYFEDIDLDCRLRRAGWDIGFTPLATAWHTLGGSRARRELKIRVRAYGNRTRLMWKHETLSSLLPDFLPVAAQSAFSLLRALFLDPLSFFAGPWLFFVTLPSLLARRRAMMRKWGGDSRWLRPWLLPETERLREKGLRI